MNDQPEQNNSIPAEEQAVPEAEKNAIEQLQQKNLEQKNQLLRALADFDNYKKRSKIEREQLVQFANEALIVDLLPILDGFSRAIAAAAKLNANEEMVKGLALVEKQFEDTLTKRGLQAIEALGKPYDPHQHEAILQKESEGEAGLVLEEMQKGYRLFDRVIRPSMVIVSKKSG